MNLITDLMVFSANFYSDLNFYFLCLLSFYLDFFHFLKMAFIFLCRLVFELYRILQQDFLYKASYWVKRQDFAWKYCHLKGQYFSWPFFSFEIQTNQESTRVLADFSVTYPTLPSSLDTWPILSLKLYFYI